MIFDLQKKNKMLMEANMRLELENDEVAQELITCDITLTTQLERVRCLVHSLPLQGTWVFLPGSLLFFDEVASLLKHLRFFYIKLLCGESLLKWHSNNMPGYNKMIVGWIKDKILGMLLNFTVFNSVVLNLFDPRNISPLA